MASPLASLKGLPFSQVMSLAMSSALAMTSSYHLRSSLERSRPVLLRKAGKASAAARMAELVSSVLNSGAVPMASPVEGSLFSL